MLLHHIQNGRNKKTTKRASPSGGVEHRTRIRALHDSTVGPVRMPGLFSSCCGPTRARRSRVFDAVLFCTMQFCSVHSNICYWYQVKVAGMVWYGMVEVCEGAPVAMGGWVLTDRHDLAHVQLI